jgi:hypothetical protein
MRARSVAVLLAVSSAALSVTTSTAAFAGMPEWPDDAAIDTAVDAALDAAVVLPDLPEEFWAEIGTGHPDQDWDWPQSPDAWTGADWENVVADAHDWDEHRGTWDWADEQPADVDRHEDHAHEAVAAEDRRDGEPASGEVAPAAPDDVAPAAAAPAAPAPEREPLETAAPDSPGAPPVVAEPVAEPRFLSELAGAPAAAAAASRTAEPGSPLAVLALLGGLCVFLAAAVGRIAEPSAAARFRREVRLALRTRKPDATS